MHHQALMEVASRQYHCFTRDQALLIMTDAQLRTLLRNGTVVRCWPAVYQFAGMEWSWEQDLMAVLLSCPGSVASGRSALRLHGSRELPSHKLEITVVRGRSHQRNGVKVRESEQLDRFVTVVNGIPSTTIARALTDMTEELPEQRLAKVLDDVLRLNLVTLAQVRLCLDVMKTKGRRRISRLRNILDQRNITDESLDTELERMALEAIRGAGFPEPKGKGYVVVNGTRYEPDLWYPDAKIIIEPGGPHHQLPTVAAKDRERDADFQLDGWFVHTWYYDTNPATFLDQLRQALNRLSKRI